MYFNMYGHVPSSEPTLISFSLLLLYTQKWQTPTRRLWVAEKAHPAKYGLLHSIIISIVVDVDWSEERRGGRNSRYTITHIMVINDNERQADPAACWWRMMGDYWVGGITGAYRLYLSQTT